MILLLLTSTSLVFAGGDADIVRELKLRNLIVQMLEEDPAIVKKLSKEPLKLQQYQKNIQSSNALLKKTVGRFWKLHSAPLYKTKTEITIMKAAEEEKKKK